MSALLGCNLGDLKIHLEKQFPEGMTWENRHLWHIDHIKPLSSFDLMEPEQAFEACNFKNLQPLWAHENLKKGAKIDFQTSRDYDAKTRTGDNPGTAGNTARVRVERAIANDWGVHTQNASDRTKRGVVHDPHTCQAQARSRRTLGEE